MHMHTPCIMAHNCRSSGTNLHCIHHDKAVIYANAYPLHQAVINARSLFTSFNANENYRKPQRQIACYTRNPVAYTTTEITVVHHNTPAGNSQLSKMKEVGQSFCACLPWKCVYALALSLSLTDPSVIPLTHSHMQHTRQTHA